jgi:hypothetical protein
MLRLLFFLSLLAAVTLNTLALFVGGNPGFGADEYAITGSLVCLLFACVLMARLGRVFNMTGHWVWVEDEKSTKVSTPVLSSNCFNSKHLGSSNDGLSISPRTR